MREQEWLDRYVLVAPPMPRQLDMVITPSMTLEDLAKLHADWTWAYAKAMIEKRKESIMRDKTP